MMALGMLVAGGIPDPGRMRMAGGIVFGLAVVILLVSQLYIVSGIGVLKRWSWGRLMTLGLAVLSGVAGILMIIGYLTQPGFASPHEIPGGRLGSLFIALTTLLLFIHCIMSFVVLLSSRNAAEFE